MIVTATDVRKAAEAQLRANLPHILEKVAAATGVTLTEPKTWRRLPDFLLLTEQQSPAVVVTSPGIEGAPVTMSDGTSDVTWLVRAFCVVRGRTYDETADRVGAFTAALRAALLSDVLDGLATDVEWRAETYAELDTSDSRTIGAGSVTVAYTCTTDLDLDDVPVTLTALTTDLLPVL